MPGLLALSLRGRESPGVLILVTLPGALGAGLMDRRPRGARAAPAISQLRHHLEGATIESVASGHNATCVSLERDGKPLQLLTAGTRPYGAWWLLGPDGSIVLRSPGAPREAPREQDRLESIGAQQLRAQAPATWEAYRSASKRQLERALRTRIKRLERKREAIRGDLERASSAGALRERASLLLAHVHEIPAGADHVRVRTWDDPPREIRIDLDPRKSATELAQEMFAKAKRLERGLEIATGRLDAVEAELCDLIKLVETIGDRDPEELANELDALGLDTIAPKERARKRKRATERRPYREFAIADGAVALVGRSAADNDRLTLRVARPHDLWLHTRGVTGAHVVVPLSKGKTCTSEALVDAATLAAHFSDLRGEPVVDVLYTPRRYVRKRKGDPVGAVVLDREKVLAVRVEPQRLARLLESETRNPRDSA